MTVGPSQICAVSSEIFKPLETLKILEGQPQTSTQSVVSAIGETHLSQRSLKSSAGAKMLCPTNAWRKSQQINLLAVVANQTVVTLWFSGAPSRWLYTITAKFQQPCPTQPLPTPSVAPRALRTSCLNCAHRWYQVIREAMKAEAPARTALEATPKLRHGRRVLSEPNYILQASKAANKYVKPWRKELH